MIKNGVGEELFFINNSVYKMNVLDNNLPVSTFISKNNRNFYGLGIDKYTEDIYITDALDYIQNGIVYSYKSSGIQNSSFYVGLIPQFVF